MLSLTMGSHSKWGNLVATTMNWNSSKSHVFSYNVNTYLMTWAVIHSIEASWGKGVNRRGSRERLQTSYKWLEKHGSQVTGGKTQQSPTKTTLTQFEKWKSPDMSAERESSAEMSGLSANIKLKWVNPADVPDVTAPTGSNSYRGLSHLEGVVTLHSQWKLTGKSSGLCRAFPLWFSLWVNWLRRRFTLYKHRRVWVTTLKS